MECEFSPTIWPETKVPPEALDCQKCELYRQRSRMIWGEGNTSAPVLLILDNPGAREDKDGNAYVCGTRQTLQLAAFNAGFKAEDLYVTYVLKCQPKRQYNKEEARGTCMEHLNNQLLQQKPKLAFCLGNVAVQWFFDDMEKDVKTLRGTWHFSKGIPTAVTYHPLAVRRRPNLLPYFTNDWEMLAQRYYKEILHK
ncbi:MAG TPA: uracil-DNA glycosylase [Clostridiales bacterium]|nr:uracil-DNA glycosylase [Clostridiales bacterium]